jgi:hypothetical protein
MPAPRLRTTMRAGVDLLRRGASVRRRRTQAGPRRATRAALAGALTILALGPVASAQAADVLGTVQQTAAAAVPAAQATAGAVTQSADGAVQAASNAAAAPEPAAAVAQAVQQVAVPATETVARIAAPATRTAERAAAPVERAAAPATEPAAAVTHGVSHAASHVTRAATHVAAAVRDTDAAGIVRRVAPHAPADRAVRRVVHRVAGPLAGRVHTTVGRILDPALPLPQPAQRPQPPLQGGPAPTIPVPRTTPAAPPLSGSAPVERGGGAMAALPAGGPAAGTTLTSATAASAAGAPAQLLFGAGTGVLFAAPRAPAGVRPGRRGAYAATPGVRGPGAAARTFALLPGAGPASQAAPNPAASRALAKAHAAPRGGRTAPGAPWSVAGAGAAGAGTGLPLVPVLALLTFSLISSAGARRIRLASPGGLPVAPLAPLERPG